MSRRNVGLIDAGAEGLVFSRVRISKSFEEN